MMKRIALLLPLLFRAFAFAEGSDTVQVSYLGPEGVRFAGRCNAAEKSLKQTKKTQ